MDLFQQAENLKTENGFLFSDRDEDMRGVNINNSDFKINDSNLLDDNDLQNQMFNDLISDRNNNGVGSNNYPSNRGGLYSSKKNQFESTQKEFMSL